MGRRFRIFSIFLFLYIVAKFFYRKSRRPTLHNGEPIGEVVTISVTVQKAWELFDDSKKAANQSHWIMRVAPGVHVFTMLGQYQTPSPQIAGEFKPGETIELDMYCYPPSDQHWKRSSLFLTIRAFDPIDHIRLGRTDAISFPLGMYWLDHATIELEVNTGGSVSENPQDLPLVFANHVAACSDRLLMDMAHPIYHDTCTLIDERETQSL